MHSASVNLELSLIVHYQLETSFPMSIAFSIEQNSIPVLSFALWILDEAKVRTVFE